ncbi:ADP-ribose pyrophosphatase [Clostridiales Family XIII bacterium PM5-7]
MISIERTINSEKIYQGKILNLRKDTVTSINGTSTREIIEHKGGSVIAAINDDGKMVMVKQYRKPAERVMLEVPAGKVDPNEQPLETALRELKEETGYTAEHARFLTRMYTSVGYSEEILYLYLCTGLTKGEPDFDENEAIDIVEYEVEQLYNMVMAGEIEDGKSQVAILMVKGLLEEGERNGNQ